MPVKNSTHRENVIAGRQYIAHMVIPTEQHSITCTIIHIRSTNCYIVYIIDAIASNLL